MTAKRKRRRSRAGGGSSGRAAETGTKAVEKESSPKKAPAREAPLPPESPYPSLAQSLSRGLRAVGSSPEIMATAFLSVLATWGLFVALGTEPDPRTTSLLLSAPPVHVFSDAPVAISRGSSTVFSVAAVGAFALLRGVTFGGLTLLIVQALREGRVSVTGTARALPRTALVFAGLYLIQFGLAVAAFQLLLGFLGQLAVLAIAAGLYFLVFSPIIAAAEGVGPRQAVRLSVRAARLPGTRHLSMSMTYFLLLFYSGAIAPFGVLTPATPSIAAWAYALAATFLHVSVLAAFAYRWLAVREEVPGAVREG